MSSLSDLDFLNATLAPANQAQAGAAGSAPVTAGDSLVQTAPPTDASSPSSPPTSAPAAPPLAALLASVQSAAASASVLAASSAINVAPATGGDETELDDAALSAMLAKLDEAEGAADDLEGRLDGLISNLDQILGALGAMGGQAGADGADGPAEPVVEESKE